MNHGEKHSVECLPARSLFPLCEPHLNFNIIGISDRKAEYVFIYFVRKYQQLISTKLSAFYPTNWTYVIYFALDTVFLII